MTVQATAEERDRRNQQQLDVIKAAAAQLTYR